MEGKGAGVRVQVGTGRREDGEAASESVLGN